jgi:hypothetical protein
VRAFTALAARAGLTPIIYPTENDLKVINLLGKVFCESFTCELMEDGVIHGDVKLSDWQDSCVDISREAVFTKSLKLKEDNLHGRDGIHPLVLVLRLLHTHSTHISGVL